MLFNKIVGFKDDILTPIGYRKISKILNQEGLLTPEGCVFNPSHVFSIYKKGKVRMERVTRKDIVLVSNPVVTVFQSIESMIEKYNQE